MLCSVSALPRTRMDDGPWFGDDYLYHTPRMDLDRRRFFVFRLSRKPYTSKECQAGGPLLPQSVSQIPTSTVSSAGNRLQISLYGPAWSVAEEEPLEGNREPAVSFPAADLIGRVIAYHYPTKCWNGSGAEFLVMAG